MGYKNLSQCLQDLERTGRLIRIEQEVDPFLQAGAIQRRVFQANGPALLMTRVKGCQFSLAGNIFGHRERIRYIFRDTVDLVQKLIRIKAEPWEIFKNPGLWPKMPKAALNSKPRLTKKGPVLEKSCKLSHLPQLVSWPGDGGAFITLPQVYSQDPDQPGFRNSNLGMYRVQINRGQYAPEQEAGLHYQIHRGIGPHHAKALQAGKELAVNISVGGPPALCLAAVMPLPEGMPEVLFAGVLAGGRIPFVQDQNRLPMPAQAEFCLSGRIKPGHTLPEGPFGDHLGYYSLEHEFPVLSIDQVRHRDGAIWPFTTVGRPPQEDSVFGEFIHELTQPMLPKVFSGVREVNAVDQAGVHPLLLALGSERYVPFARNRMPQEILTNALSLLGNTQTALSKYVFIAAHEDAPGLSTKDIPGFLQHMLRKMDLGRDLHFITRTTMDTLDYSGISLNQGSKLILAAAGPDKRSLDHKPPAVHWPEGFGLVRLFCPGILLFSGPDHCLERDQQDPGLQRLCQVLSQQAQSFLGLPLLVLVDDPEFCSQSWDNFLWVAFTRSDPATDIYGLNSFVHCKHWGCYPSMVLDARLKKHHPQPLEPDPEVEKSVDALGAPGGPLHGII
ncbi:MAG: UbiD family decarboxylase [Desulfohalobiaceae bacterium]